MALKFQYNKTYLQQLNKGLKVRVNALPTLEAKESALRLEVKKAREAVVKIERQLEREYAAQNETHRLWRELPQGLVGVKEVAVDVKKIAGVKTPVLRDVSFAVARYSAFLLPSWVPAGIETLKQLSRLRIEAELAKKKVTVLEYARKKTTQKVNLYEKVQIPEYQEAIMKIKRFMEDEDNLSKSSQKILKAKIAALEAA
ncbi:MAG: V-type ATP synthase subunit D [Chitinispirillaceae bacterium]|nr:V-type ATP synthase subunit D [Chitinispirillaceae bacterium]